MQFSFFLFFQYKRELDHCHDRIKTLTLIITDKKNEIMRLEERETSFQSDLCELRAKELEAARERTSSAQVGRSQCALVSICTDAI